MVERSFPALPMLKNPLHYIHKYPQRTKQLLGIDYNQFLQLLEQAQLKHAESQSEMERQKNRVNAKGGGRKPLLSVAEEVCLNSSMPNRLRFVLYSRGNLTPREPASCRSRC